MSSSNWIINFIVQSRIAWTGILHRVKHRKSNEFQKFIVSSRLHHLHRICVGLIFIFYTRVWTFSHVLSNIQNLIEKFFTHSQRPNIADSMSAQQQVDMRVKIEFLTVLRRSKSKSLSLVYFVFYLSHIVDRAAFQRVESKLKGGKEETMMFRAARCYDVIG